MSAPCPVCSALAAKSFAKKPSRYHTCSSCNTIFQYPMPTVEETKAYTDQSYSAGAYLDYIKAKEMKVATFRQRVNQIKSFLPAVEKIRHLDIGCSAGFMIEVGLESGFDSYGTEFSSEAIKQALPEIQTRIRQGDVNQIAGSEQERYHLITCFDIIEHVQNPKEFLTQLHRLLMPGGILVLTTPDVEHPLAKAMGSRWPMLLPAQHTVLFSKKSLTQVLGSVGLSTINQSAAYKFLSFNYLTTAISEVNPNISKVMATLGKVIPKKVSSRPYKLNISEFMTIAQS